MLSSRWVFSFYYRTADGCGCFLCLGRELTPHVSLVNQSYFCDKPRLVPCTLWWVWYLHPVSRENARFSYDKLRFADGRCGGIGTCRLFTPSRWTPSRTSSTRSGRGLGGSGDPLCLAVRKVAEWRNILNGGFATRSAKAFQAG